MLTAHSLTGSLLMSGLLVAPISCHRYINIVQTTTTTTTTIAGAGKQACGTCNFPSSTHERAQDEWEVGSWSRILLQPDLESSCFWKGTFRFWQHSPLSGSRIASLGCGQDYTAYETMSCSRQDNQERSVGCCSFSKASLQGLDHIRTSASRVSAFQSPISTSLRCLGSNSPRVEFVPCGLSSGVVAGPAVRRSTIVQSRSTTIPEQSLHYRSAPGDRDRA